MVSRQCVNSPEMKLVAADSTLYIQPNHIRAHYDCSQCAAGFHHQAPRTVATST